MKRYQIEYSEEQLKTILTSRNKKAAELITDQSRWEKFREKASKFLLKLTDVPGVGDWVDEVYTMIDLVDSYTRKEYTAIPFATIVTITAALIYVISPLNLIPDFIPLIGYIDDAAVIFAVIHSGAGHDLEKYRAWQEEHRKENLLALAKDTGKIIQDMLQGRRMAALLLAKNGRFQILAVSPENREETPPYQVQIRRLSLPVDLLKTLNIDTEEAYLTFLNDVLENTKFQWSPIGMLRAIPREQFDEKYSDYFCR